MRLFLLVSLVLMSGCIDLAQVEKMRDDAVKLRETLHASERDWEGRIASLPASDPRRPQAEASLSAARAQSHAVDAAVQELNEVIRQARNPDDPILSVGAPFLPEPFRSPILLGGALIAMAARTIQLKRGVASIAQSLQKAMEEDDQFLSGMKKHANTFRSIQTRTAQKIVNQATGKGRSLAMPI